MSETLIAAEQLASMPFDDLVRATLYSKVHATRAHDVFDLADLLLSHEATTRRLAHATREAIDTLRALASSDETTMPSRTVAEQLVGLVLVHEVDAQQPMTQNRREDAPAAGTRRLLPYEAALQALDDTSSTDAASSTSAALPNPDAFINSPATTVRLAAEMLRALLEEPAHARGRGGVAQPDRRRLAERLGIDLEAVSVILELISEHSLLGMDARRRIGVTEPGRRWLEAPAAVQWLSLVMAWRAAIPLPLGPALADWVRSVAADAGDDLDIVAFAHHEFPLGRPWLDRALAGTVSSGFSLGLLDSNSELTPAGVAAITQTLDTDSDGLPEFPPTIDYVYVQQDLTVVAPGRLDPVLDTRLRQLAELTQAGDANIYQISPHGLTRAMTSGWSADDLRTFFETVSRTGVPQPLEYLIDDAERKYGSIRVISTVTSGDAPARTVIVCSTSTLARVLIAERGLGMLRLQPSTETAVWSPFRAEVVIAALRAAKFPAVRAGGDGTIIPDADPATFEPAAAADEKLRTAEAALKNVLAESQASSSIERELDVAIRHRMQLSMTIRLPDRSERTMVLEPIAVRSGRLSARDTASAVERTLPIANIVSVAQLESPAEA